MTSPKTDIMLDLSAVADPIGTVIEIRGQRYTAVAVRPREIVWRAGCQTCGAPFEAVTPRNRIVDLIRRCAQHRSPGRPAV